MSVQDTAARRNFARGMGQDLGLRFRSKMENCKKYPNPNRRFQFLENDSNFRFGFDPDVDYALLSRSVRRNNPDRATFEYTR